MLLAHNGLLLSRKLARRTALCPIGSALLLCLSLTLAGCGDNPGAWPQEKLAEYVKESLVREGVEVTGVTLTAKAGGGFEGTSQAVGGEKFKLLVTQDPAAHRLTWDAQGDRGSFFDGSYELK